ncbi:MAG: Ig-like domain-containing protein [Stenotrophomonas sp.]
MSRTSTLRQMPRLSLLACALATALPAVAQSVGNGGRFTPVIGQAHSLYPSSLTTTDALPQAIDSSRQGLLDQVVVEVDRDGVPADGQSPVNVQVQLYDRDGKPLSGQQYVTIEHSGGRLLLPGASTDEFGPGAGDADKVIPGVQLLVENGVAQFQLLAPHDPQDVTLRITAGGHTAQGVIGFIPEMRELLATGLVDGVINFNRRSNASLISPVQHNDAFDRDIRRWEKQFNNGKASASARTAFFVKGKIKGEYLLTAAYDSDKDVRGRLLRDIQPDDYYPVYGDSSLRGFDARSAERLYVRVDNKRSYLLYGDFQTGDSLATATGLGGSGYMPQRLLGTYNRTATGLGWHYENERVRSNVFAIEDSLRQVIEEFRSQGSGPYALRNNAVLEGSERVEVITRDRNQPSRIVSVRSLARLVDYSFEPFSGRILLNQFLSSFDADLNPVSLRITYELDQGTEKFWTYGGDAQVRVTDKLEVGASVVDDRNPYAPFQMGSVNAGYRFGANTALVAEFARTRSEVNTNSLNQVGSQGLMDAVGEVEGDAWRVEFGHDGEKFDARLFAARTDPAFNNAASALYGGRGEYSANLTYRVGPRLELYVEGLRSEDRNPDGGERDAAGAGARIKAGQRLTVDLGLRSIRETIGVNSTWSTNTGYGNIGGLTGGFATGGGGGALGYGAQALDPATGLMMINGSGSGEIINSDLPIGTELESDSARLGLGYRFSDRFSAGAEVEQAISGEDRHRVAAGLDYQLFERSRVYGRYERQTGLTSAYGITTTDREADALVFGVDSTYLRDTQAFSEYRLRDAISGRDVQAASGIRNTWDVAEGLRLSSSAEHVNVIDGSTGDNTGLALALDYSANPLWRGALRVEHRISDDVRQTRDVNEAFDTTLVQFMAARKLNRDWTLLARNYLLSTDYQARGDVLQDRFQIGAAYRDTDRNRINALMRYEYKLERDESGLTLLDGNVVDGSSQDVRTRAHIVSSHADWHPSRPWWITGRVAGKWQRDQFAYGDGSRVNSSFRAMLFSGRIVYDITENWDVGVLASTFRGQNKSNQYAYGVEVGRLLRQNLWLSAGYNWTGFTGDRDLSGYEYTQQGLFLRLRFKFDEDLFRPDPVRYRDPAR